MNQIEIVRKVAAEEQALIEWAKQVASHDGLSADKLLCHGLRAKWLDAETRAASLAEQLADNSAPEMPADCDYRCNLEHNGAEITCDFHAHADTLYLQGAWLGRTNVLEMLSDSDVEALEIAGAEALDADVDSVNDSILEALALEEAVAA